MKRGHIVFLAVVCVAVSLIILLLPLRAHFIPAWDEAHHLTVALAYRYAFSQGLRSVWGVFSAFSTIYPPLYHILIALAYGIVGVRPEAGMLVHIPFVFILVFATYALGVKLLNRTAAFLAAALVVTVPSLLGLYTNVLGDAPSIALFVLSFAVLVRTNALRRRKVVLLFGAVLLLGVLTRYTILVPSVVFVAYAANSVRQAKNKKPILINILLVLAVLSLTLVWYVPHISYIQKILTLFADPQKFPVILYGAPTALNMQSVLYYPRALVDAQGLGLIPTLFFVAAFIHYLFTKKPRGLALIAGAIALSFIIPTLWLDKAAKYVAPAYPLMMLVIASWITALKKIPRLLTTGVLLGAMVGNVVLALRVFPATSSLRLAEKEAVPLLPGASWPYYQTALWPTQKIINDNFSNLTKPTFLLVLTDLPFLNHSTFGFYAALMDAPLTINQAILFYDPLSTPESVNYQGLGRYDYVFTKSGPEFGVFVNALTAQKINAYLAASPAFVVHRSYPLPDGTTGLLYARDRARAL